MVPLYCDWHQLYLFRQEWNLVYNILINLPSLLPLEHFENEKLKKYFKCSIYDLLTSLGFGHLEKPKFARKFGSGWIISQSLISSSLIKNLDKFRDPGYYFKVNYSWFLLMFFNCFLGERFCYPGFLGLFKSSILESLKKGLWKYFFSNGTNKNNWIWFWFDFFG